jgi:hypothetical protein
MYIRGVYGTGGASAVGVFAADLAVQCRYLGRSLALFTAPAAVAAASSSPPDRSSCPPRVPPGRRAAGCSTGRSTCWHDYTTCRPRGRAGFVNSRLL